MFFSGQPVWKEGELSLQAQFQGRERKKEKIMHIYESSSMVLGSLQAVSSRQRLRVISTSLPLFHSSLKPSFHPPHQTASFSESRHLDSKRIKCIFSPEPRVRLLSSPKGSHIRPTPRFPFSHHLISHLSPLHPPLPKWTFSSWGCLVSERRCVGNGFWVGGLWRENSLLPSFRDRGREGGHVSIS